MSNYDSVPLNRSEPDYLAGYGLRTAPFADTHDDRFVYLDGERQQLLDMLNHPTRYSRLMLLVIGEYGSGKSCLRRLFVNQADESALICEIEAHPMMDADELLGAIARGFGLFEIPASPGELHDALYRYLAGLQQQDRVPLLLVDDAHELSRDALEALFYLCDAETGEGELLRSVLFCEPAIEVMLESAAIQPLNERVTHRVRLRPFDADQTAEYIRHRLAVAGLEGTSPFSPRDIRRLHEAAGGMPERINRLADQFLAEGGIDVPELDEEAIVPVLAHNRSLFGRRSVLAGTLLLGLVALVVWWQFAGDPVPEAAPELTENNPASREFPASEPVVEPDAGPAVGPSSDSEVQASGEQQPLTDTGSPVTATASVLRIDALEPDPVPAREALQTLTLHGEGFDDSTRITVEWGNQRKTLLTSQVSRLDDTRLVFQINVGKQPQTWLLSARNPQTRAQDQIQFAVQAADTRELSQGEEQDQSQPDPVVEVRDERQLQVRDIAWLQRQPAAHYTLQLLAGRQAQALRRFVEQHGLTGQGVIFETRRDGEPWYAVAYGSYPDRAAAQQAAGALAKDIEPWIRRFDEIHQALATAAPAPLTSKPVPASEAARDHAAWLWDQDPGHYTLQLIAGPNEPAIHAFIARHALRGKAVFYQTRRDGKPWYVVVSGNYTGRDAAIAARRELSAALQQQSPWPRRFSAIHADLSAR